MVGVACGFGVEAREPVAVDVGGGGGGEVAEEGGQNVSVVCVAVYIPGLLCRGLGYASVRGVEETVG